MSGRRDLLVEQPIFAQIAAPNTDADAYLAVHPGAAAFYNGTQQSFMDDRLGAPKPHRRAPNALKEQHVQI